MDMDCSHCCEDDSAVRDESIESKAKQEVHPFGDQEMDRDDGAAVELEEEAVPPPPNMV